MEFTAAKKLQVFTQSELREQYPEYEDKLVQICRGRHCPDCLLEHCCPYGFTLEGLDEAYTELFGETKLNIQEDDILSLFEKEGVCPYVGT